jgi:Zn-dependent protease with chaperone function
VFLSLLLAKSLEGESPWSAFGTIWPVAIGLVVHMGFWTTLVFAVLERTTPQGRALTKWDPATLPQIPVKGTIRSLDTGAALVWLTLYIAALIGQQFFSPLLDAAGDPLPVINPELWSFWLPYFIGLAVLEAVFAVVLHRTRHWTVPLAIVNTALALAFTIPAIILLWAGDVMNPAFAERLDLTALFSAGGVVTIVLVFVTGVIAAADIIDGFVKAIRGSGSWPELPDLEELAHLNELGNLRKLRRR